ncbi:MAG: type II secretion system protein [Candidatus Saccharibacteria bacterium]|nr:type II secretion system protein [Candidatus Saccharibacteria bacterium]
MANKKLKQKKGFTIIEVVLVLAIAGLIFLMVFIALPALQRSQRDTQRSDDMARLVTAIQNYQKNNRNKLPADEDAWNDMVRRYITEAGDVFNDPSDDSRNYTIIYENGEDGVDDMADATFVANDVYITTYATCDGEAVVSSPGNRDFAIFYKYEGGGAYCYSNVNVPVEEEE